MESSELSSLPDPMISNAPKTRRTYGRQRPSVEPQDEEDTSLDEEKGQEGAETNAAERRTRFIPPSSSAITVIASDKVGQNARSSQSTATTEPNASADLTASSPSPRKRQRQSSGNHTEETTATTLPGDDDESQSSERAVNGKSMRPLQGELGEDASVTANAMTSRHHRSVGSSQLSSLPTSFLEGHRPTQPSSEHIPPSIKPKPSGSRSQLQNRSSYAESAGDVASGQEGEHDSAHEVAAVEPIRLKSNTFAGKMKARNVNANPSHRLERVGRPQAVDERDSIQNDSDSSGDDSRGARLAAGPSKADKLKALAERRRVATVLEEVEEGMPAAKAGPSTAFKPIPASVAIQHTLSGKHHESEGDELDELDDQDDDDIMNSDGSDIDNDLPDLGKTLQTVARQKKTEQALERKEMLERFKQNRRDGRANKGDKPQTKLVEDEESSSEISSGDGSCTGYEKSLWTKPKTKKTKGSRRTEAAKPLKIKPLSAREKEEMIKESERLERVNKTRKAREAYESRVEKAPPQLFGLSEMRQRIQAKEEQRKRDEQLRRSGNVLGRRVFGTHPSDPIEDFGPSTQASSSAQPRRISPRTTPPRAQHPTERAADSMSTGVKRELFLEQSDDEDPRLQTTVENMLKSHLEDLERKAAKQAWQERKLIMFARHEAKKKAIAPSHDRAGSAEGNGAGDRAMDSKPLAVLQDMEVKHVRSLVTMGSTPQAPGCAKDEYSIVKGGRAVLFAEDIATFAKEATPEPASHAHAPVHSSKHAPGFDHVTNGSLNLSLRERMRLQNRQKRSLQADLAAKKGIKALKAYDPTERTVHATAEEIEEALKAVGEGGEGNDDDNADDSDFDAGSAFSGDIEQEEASRAQFDIASGSEENDEDSEKENDPPPRSLPSSQHSFRSAATAEVHGQQDNDEDEDAGPTHQTARAHRRHAVASDEDDEETVRPSPQCRSISQGSGSRSVLGPLVQQQEQSPAMEVGELEEPNPAQGTSCSSQLMPPPPIIETQRPFGFTASGSDLKLGDEPGLSNDVFGQFFTNTQTQAKSFGLPSAPIGRQPSSVLGTEGIGGFSQFFQETQAGASTQNEDNQASAANDAFAALRKEQASKAVLDSDDMLPSIDTEDADRYEAEADEAEQRHLLQQRRAMLDTPKQYLNKYGLYTQTKPSMQSQAIESQSQDWLGATPQHSFFESVEDEHESPPLESPSKEPQQRIKRRFRLGNRQSSPAAESNKGLAMREDEQKSAQHLRGSSKQTVSQSEFRDEESADEAEELQEAQSSLPTQSQNAFQALMAGAAAAEQPQQQPESRKRKSAFIEGEAAEDSEEELGGFFSRQRKGGAMAGVFSDDEKDDGGDEEDSEDDGDAKDIEGLVDDVKEKDEAMKDEMMRQKVKEHQAEDDAALEKRVTRLVDGKWRLSKKGSSAMEDALDEDADDADDLRRIQMPAAYRAHKRTVDGEDGLEALKNNPECAAFLRSYHGAAEKAESGMNFLAEVDGGDSSGDDSDHSEGGSADDDPTREKIDMAELRKHLREQKRLAREELRRKAQRIEDDESEDEREAAEHEKQEAEQLKRKRELNSDDEGQIEVHDRLRSREAAIALAPSTLHGASAGQAEEDDYHLRLFKARTAPNKERLEEFAQENDFSNRAQTFQMGGEGGGGRSGAGHGSSVTSFLTNGRAARTADASQQKKAGSKSTWTTNTSGAGAAMKNPTQAPTKAKVLTALSSRSQKFK
ncbi:hypothetical protein K437DRAFT_257495 [Tilletiaria anomala UBC 951]|uniref:DNA replication checkpoint mediator MRC1 domain-containing protein n=1 Tax=Tilletiaria anomala (strain ATCC 24038 / CBS 436.72 / UBC 951) TaxID=1037660 RepID=A0A066VX97_TILAU|nr:uncharacterized protein K437DRAFT_257495 [Tilletiaria anomala UBC 951]KDN43434.1 hypothetical protein K437DRAFT_257495 [Tilletiaria anomala UBC 951]